MGRKGSLFLPSLSHDLDHGNRTATQFRRRRWEVAMDTQKSEEANRTLSASPQGTEPAPLRVLCFSTYVSDPLRQEPRHRDVRNFLLALRGERISAESSIPV